MLKKFKNRPWYVPFPIPLIFPMIGLSLVGMDYLNKQQQAAETAKQAQLTAVVKAKTVTALGKLAPKGEIIKLSAPTSIDGVKIEKLLVEEGDTVKAGQLIAVLDSHERLQASVNEAKGKVAVTRASLSKVKAGSKQGEIKAQQAVLDRLTATRGAQIAAQTATVNKLVVETATNIEAQKATISRLIAETDTNVEAQKGAIAEAQAGLVNARIEDKRYANLAREGAVSASSGDSKRLTLQTSQQKVNQAQANLKRIKASGQQQIAEARANLRRIQASGQQQILEARANLSKIDAETQQQIREGKFTLNKIMEVRPVDVMAAETDVQSVIASEKVAEKNLAKAYIKSPQDGQILQVYARPGTVVGNDGIADLGRTSQMEAVVEVYQSDVSKVRVGQKVKVTSSSLAGELQGIVKRVGIQVKRQNTINADPTSNIDDRIVEVHVVLDPESTQKAAKFTNLQIQAVIALDSQ
jgi:HlyD family secretion protein